MVPRILAPGFGVTSQMTLSDIAAARDTGYVGIINDRPDGEEPGQPASAELAEKARTLGLAYWHIPVAPGRFEDEQIDAFRSALDGCDGPVLGFCKSGLRATSLWALGQVGVLSDNELIGTAAACGYDLTPLRPRIAERAATRKAGTAA